MNISAITDQILLYYRPILEIAIIAVFFYFIFVFIRGTRAVQVIQGLIVILVVFFIAQKLHLTAINWLLTRFFTFAAVACVIIFQPEFRKALAQIGKRPLFSPYIVEEDVIDAVVQAATTLSAKKIGALIAIERYTGLRNFIDSGVKMDSKISGEIIHTIFMPNTPLHDGGVIIQGDRIAAAACLFPLSQKPNLSRSMGTRHRAAIGLTEETDAVVIVVSEETGTISIAIEEKITRDFDESSLKKNLKEILVRQKKKHEKPS
ncbi:MAG TPA: diadenylate cyclase CdaA [bacterium]|nr:diadenylate cyclase CdaA [bacterium]